MERIEDDDFAGRTARTRSGGLPGATRPNRRKNSGRAATVERHSGRGATKTEAPVDSGGARGHHRRQQEALGQGAAWEAGGQGPMIIQPANRRFGVSRGAWEL